MNELKPEDVMRALECHYKEWKIPTDGMMHCDDCPYNSVDNCSVELVRDALALLREKDAERKELWEERNRIYAELQEWKAECKKYQDAWKEKDAETKGLVDGWSKDQDRFEQVCAEKDAEIEMLTKSRDLANAEREANVKGFTSEVEKLTVEIEALKIANEKMYAANKEQEAEIERLTIELQAMRGAANSYKIYYENGIKIEGHPDPVGEKGECGLKHKCRAEAITEFAERMGKALTAQVNVSSNEMLAAFMWCLDLVKNVGKQLKGETDGETDL